MAVDHVKRPDSGGGSGGGPGPAIGLERVRTTAPGLVNLYKQAAVSLEKHRLTGERAAVHLVLDRSGSMRPYYRDGSVQHLAEQVLGLAAHLDDDGRVPVVFFSTDVDGAAEVSLDDYAGRVGALHDSLGHMGRTNYHLAMEAVIEHHRESGADTPALVVFQTDGGPSSRAAAERVLCEAARLPLFWQFIGFGEDEFRFLRKLDELPVPAKRVVDNAGFFAAGPDPRAVSDAVLYDRLTGEFPDWLRAARAAGIVR
ncbi:VWA domain-containing protein [Streptomyces sp. TRM 70361]|uniref:vWA domain-containing protein n=1 Tax=Streptomyces sp. TRM 70361 TaxID=3116553 RepID=UPI002E7BECC1|nr:VWA domain-containing protein [Streptomyces sp. TRM 70361]MEE1938694.1 VWA domain-containing protein [Streptomyces sp. TRM 70361]